MKTLKKQKRSVTPHKSPANAEYVNFLTSIELFALVLTRCSSEINRDLYMPLISGDDKAKKSITAEYSILEIDKGSFDCSSRLQLIVRDQSEKTALSLDAVFQAHFHVGIAFTKEMAQQFADTELRLVVWPYLRQLVQDLTSRMWIPPIVIPFVTRHNPDIGG
jgi:hypothetical protein